MSKFFVKTEQINNNDIVIIGDDVNHIINVLRMKKTDEIQICNQDTGDNYNAEIVNYSKNEVECKIKDKINATTESNVHITLFQGIPKFEKMELIIQKNTEVGIKSIVPVIMERTVVKLDEKIASKKLERWQKIAEIAAKQSMRDIIPQIGNIERKIKSNNYSEQQYNIAIVIGPEGGISEKELVMLAEKNAKFVSLGKRILRTETAGVVMAGNIIYELEYNS